MRVLRFKINERDAERGGRKRYRHFTRRFYSFYNKAEELIFGFRFETIVYKKDRDISIRFSINPDGDQGWGGHFLLFGIGFFWGFEGFRKLAERLVRCKGYPYDSRTWSIHTSSDARIYWEFARHDDMCRGSECGKPLGHSGHLNFNLVEKIRGPIRYTYEDLDHFATTIKMPEGEYAAVLTLRKCYLGRTKVNKSKHKRSYEIDVDSPKGIPTHYDKSGGYKGDRTYGFGVNFPYNRSQGWQQDAEALVTARVLTWRGESGFREPQS